MRLASQLAPVDPFDDPFGDKEHSAPSPVLSAPTAIAPPTTVSTDASSLATPPVAAEQPAGREEDPPLIPQGNLSPAPAAAVEDSSPSAAAEEYNGRDCTNEIAKCQEARLYVQSNPITKISLDITPVLTVAKLERQREFDDQRFLLEMTRVPSRVFRDRKGNRIAEGRLTDYRNGRVSIDRSDGDITQVPFADLSDDDMCFVTGWWSIPAECSLGDDEYLSRNWLASTMTWKASGVCHKPLYFEEVQLERYGHSAGPIVQPVLSGAHFFLNIAALPYKMGIHPPHECQYPLGYYRPGSCAPWLVPPTPVSIRGGLLAAGLYTGGVFFLP